MTEYLVCWEIELSAESPREAALLALEIQRDVDSLALRFDVAPLPPQPLEDTEEFYLLFDEIDLYEDPS